MQRYGERIKLESREVGYLRSRIIDQQNQRKTRHKQRGMSKAEFRERLMEDLQFFDTVREWE